MPRLQRSGHRQAGVFLFLFFFFLFLFLRQGDQSTGRKAMDRREGTAWTISGIGCVQDQLYFLPLSLSYLLPLIPPFSPKRFFFFFI